jgi:hypothetical protein
MLVLGVSSMAVSAFALAALLLFQTRQPMAIAGRWMILAACATFCAGCVVFPHVCCRAHSLL